MSSKLRLLNSNGVGMQLKVSDDRTEDRVVELDQLADAVENQITPFARSAMSSGTLALTNKIKRKTTDVSVWTGDGSTGGAITGMTSIDFTKPGNGTGYYLDREGEGGDYSLTYSVRNDEGDVIPSGTIQANISLLHLKSTNSTGNNVYFDGLRGEDRYFVCNGASVESGNNSLLFTDNGYTFSDPSMGANSGTEYVGYQRVTNTISWGITEDGVRWVSAYDVNTGNSLILHTSVGIAGLKIPHHLGVKPHITTHKPMHISGLMMMHGIGIERIRISNNEADILDQDVYEVYSDNEHVVINTNNSGWNEAGGRYWVECRATSLNQVLMEYRGSSLPRTIELRNSIDDLIKKPLRITVKGIDNTQSLQYWDAERKTDNDVYWKRLSMSTNTEQNDDSTYLVRGVDGGVYINSTWSAINGVGYRYLLIVEVDTDGDESGSYYEATTEETHLQISDAKFTVSKGISKHGYVNELKSVDQTLSFDSLLSGRYWVGLDFESNEFITTEYLPKCSNTDDCPVGGFYFDYELGYYRKKLPPVLVRNTESKYLVDRVAHYLTETPSGTYDLTLTNVLGDSRFPNAIRIGPSIGSHAHFDASILNDSGGNITFSQMIYIDNDQNSMPIFEATENSGTTLFGLYYTGIGEVQGSLANESFQIINNSQSEVVVWEQPSAGFYHIVLIARDTGKYDLLVNGILVGGMYREAWIDIDVPSDRVLSYGSNIKGTDLDTNITIAEIEIHHRAFTVEDASALYGKIESIYEDRQISFIRYAIDITEGQPQKISDYPTLPLDFMESIDVSGLTSLNGNVKVVDFGIVYTNDRYEQDNPFGDENFLGCIAQLYVYDGVEWADPGWLFSSNAPTSIGMRAGCTSKGIVIQCGHSYIIDDQSQYSGGLHGPGNNLTSAPAMVVVHYIGRSSDA